MKDIKDMNHKILMLPSEVKMSKLFVTLIALFLMMTGSVLAAEPETRQFAPVQGGFVKSAPEVPLWATDHLLVQFTVEGLQLANLPQRGEKAMGADARTGLASLDQLLNEMGADGLRAAFPAVANKSKAAALGTDRWYIIDLAPGADVPELAKRLASNLHLADAIPDMVAFPAVIPNDDMHPANWGHNNTAQLPGYDWGGSWDHTLEGVGTIGADANAHLAWDENQGYGDNSVVIAILDTGVDAGHPDLLQVTGYDFGDDDSNPTDNGAGGGHGTACAGVAAGITNNQIGVSGIAGNCSIMPVKVANSSGHLLFSAISAGIYFAADNGADVISMSFGSYVPGDAPTDSAITYASNRGVTMLAATGNNNFDQISYPAYNAKVIGVGAASPDGYRKRSGNLNEVNPHVVPDPNGCTVDGERWWGSSYGSTIQDSQGAVDIIAPTILPTTDIQGPYGYDPGNYSNFFNGTSCATPYAAGVCALIISANPEFTPSQVRHQLLNTAQDVVNVESVQGWDRYSGYGFVDAAAAVGAVIPLAIEASFSADETTGCAPFTVNFSDLSTGVIDSWEWQFGNGTSSTDQDPTHEYTTPGVYDVSLTITNADGSDSTARLGYIVVTGSPLVSFNSSITILVAGETVHFTDSSMGNPHDWLWDFGDGGSATAQNPSHVFNTPGVYSVKLATTNACGTDSLTIPRMLVVGEPTKVRFALAQNYPNPFNPSTTFQFSLDKPGYARLEVYDISGRRIATLVDGDKEAGQYEITWRPLDLASGVYFSRLTFGEKIETRRVILLK